MDPAIAPTPRSEGVVTFLLTDVVASSRLWRDSPDAAAAIGRQAELIATAAREACGVRPPDQGEGDSTLWVFDRPAQALAAALEAQRSLTAEGWPEGAEIEVRMAVHSGEAERLEGGNYGGLSLIRCARLRDLAHGGQVLTTVATAALAADSLPGSCTLAELGVVSLPGLERAERVFELRHPGLAGGSSRLGWLRASPSQGPTPWPTDLVGRTVERAEVARLLTETRLVTINGVGGSGKTRLAHAVAEDLSDEFPDGVVWVELARLAEGGQVAVAVLEACGGIESTTLPTLELLGRQLANAELLLVIDNCEHVLDACAELSDTVLREAPRVRLLTTSREPLSVQGEVSWRIPSLSLAAEGERDLGKIGESEAVRLFVERARAAHPEFALVEEVAADVARLCRRLDGIPLAIELAAARVRALSVARLVEGLDDRFRLLTGGARTALPRQRTLLASVEWSHDLLDEKERCLFRRLAVFAAPFTLDAAEAVVADPSLDGLGVFDLLARLVDKSLVTHAGDDRYRMLETLRQFALERAHEADELAASRDRHLAWFLGRAREWGLDVHMETDPVLDAIDQEKPDLLAALEWSQSAPRELALPLLTALGRFWFVRSGRAELRVVAHRVLDRLEEGSPGWLRALAPLSAALFFAGDPTWIPAAARALAEHEEALSDGERARLEGAIGTGPASHGRPEGIARWRRSVELSRRSGSRGVIVDHTIGLTIMLTQVGRLAEARPLLSWVERNIRPGDALKWGPNLAKAWIALFSAEYETATALFERVQMHSYDRGATSGWLALVALWTQDRALADRAMTALAGCPDLGVFERFCTVAGAVTEILSDDLEAAKRVLRTEVGSPQIGTTVYWPQLSAAELELATSDLDAAEKTCDEVASQLSACEVPLFQAWLGDARAHLARGRGAHAEAETLAHGALALTVENGLHHLQSEILETLGVLAADAGRRDEAGRLLGATQSFRDAHGIRFRWPHRAAGVEAALTGLDPLYMTEGTAIPLAEAAAYCRRGRGERGRPDTGWEALTPTEHRVVELVAEGRSNKDTAAELFVSVATVKTHLVHVFAKLGVKSRAQLAAMVARRAS